MNQDTFNMMLTKEIEDGSIRKHLNEFFEYDIKTGGVLTQAERNLILRALERAEQKYREESEE